MDQHPTLKYSFYQLLYDMESMEPKVRVVGLTADTVQRYSLKLFFFIGKLSI